VSFFAFNSGYGSAEAVQKLLKSINVWQTYSRIYSLSRF